MANIKATFTIPASAGAVTVDVTDLVYDAVSNGLSNVDLLVRLADETSTALVTKYATISSSRHATTGQRPKLTVNGGDIAANKFNYTAQNDATINYGTSTIGYIQRRQSPDAINRTMLSFSLSGISSVASAALTLYIEAIDGVAGETAEVYKITRADWVETESTWNIYKAASNWTTAGGDYTADGTPKPEVVTGIMTTRSKFW